MFSDREAILQGQVWRLVSWIFIPDTLSPIWVIFYLMIVWWTGDLLENTWGAFRLNAYYFLGMFFCIASALIFGASGGNVFLNLSLFLAVATLAPNLEILFLLVIPLKLKWVALISLLWPAYILVTGSLPVKMIVVMCLGNYLIFFGPSFLRTISREPQRLTIVAQNLKPPRMTLRLCIAAKSVASPRSRIPTPTSAWPTMEKSTAPAICRTKKSRVDSRPPPHSRWRDKRYG